MPPDRHAETGETTAPVASRAAVLLVLLALGLAAALPGPAAAGGGNADLRARIYELKTALDGQRTESRRLREENAALTRKLERLRERLTVRAGRIDTLEQRLAKAQESRRGGAQALSKTRWRRRLAEVRATRAAYRADTLADRLAAARQAAKAAAARVTARLDGVLDRLAAGLARVDTLSVPTEPAAGGPAPERTDSAARARRLTAACRSFADTLQRMRPAPLGRPVAQGTRSSGFGRRVHPITRQRHRHTGLDIAAPRGTKVRATAAGTVRRAATEDGYGRYVELRHADGHVTRYAHLADLRVEPGAEIARGQVLGTVGTTGLSTGPHLHYEVRGPDGAPRDPKPYVDALAPLADAAPAAPADGGAS
jgi:murein DD-endopeptidase MepM/ murein hydrolase activator NlpD